MATLVLVRDSISGRGLRSLYSSAACNRGPLTNE